MKKVFSLFVKALALVLLFSAFLVPAALAKGLAQDVTPPAPAAFDPTVLPQMVVALIVVGVLYFVVAFLVYHGTDLLKMLTRAIADHVPGFSWAGISGYGSYIVAVLLSAVAVFWPNSGLAGALSSLLAALHIPVDANLVQVLTTFLISLMAAAQHNSGKMPSPLTVAKKK